MGKKGNRRDRDITEEPEDGWMHDDDALMLGEGVFYSFPVEFLGSVTIQTSLSSLPVDKRTTCARHMMERLMVEAKRLKKPSKIGKEFLPFVSGEIIVAEIEVSLGISSDGMVVIPLKNGQEQPLLFFHSMPMISIATGGTKTTYDLCAYVAKDASGHRAVYIFNCGELSDEVLDTFGQSFRLAQEIAMKKRERPDTQRVKQEYLNSAAEEAPAQDQGGVADLEAVMEQPEYDEPSSVDAPIYEMGDAAVEAPLYDAPSAAPVEDPIYDTASEALVKALNKKDNVRRSIRASIKPVKKEKKKSIKKPPKEKVVQKDVVLNTVDTEGGDFKRPSWVCISEAALENSERQEGLGSLLAQFKAQAVGIEEEDEEETDDEEDD